ncbi:MAG: ferritin-like domain-containing protein [Polyangiaceae bacterium]
MNLPADDPRNKKPVDIASLSITFLEARSKEESACCYSHYWNYPRGGGRPMLSASGSPRLGNTRARRASSGYVDSERSKAEVSCAAELRARLANHWVREALMEHGSIAGFGESALDLLALGAPIELVRDTHSAALDEIEHARIATTLATRYGASVEPDRLERTARSTPSFAELAVSTFLEACVNETIAALVVLEGARAAENPELASILGRVAEDELRHVELGWRVLAWALATGGAPAREALIAAFDALDRARSTDTLVTKDDSDSDLASHGVLGASAQALVRERAWTEVIAPSARALLCH